MKLKGVFSLFSLPPILSPEVLRRIQPRGWPAAAGSGRDGCGWWSRPRVQSL